MQKIIEKEKSTFPIDEESLCFKSGICGFLAGNDSVQIRKEVLSLPIRFFPR